MTVTKYVCVHGHFYQPPRENPWLESIEPQDSAAPYHDWNERVNAECYEPNTASRILDEEHRIVDIVNNFARISFNVGPTLLEWMEASAPSVYEAILAADRESRERFGGHGSALAQGYSHVIMPLAAAEDKELQVVWAIRDFEHRFGRKPEGMWLPETAVDLATLELLAAHGIRFTILAPSQAARVRRKGDARWQDVSGSRIDPTRAYVQKLPSGGEIHLFFYDGPVSRAIAFEGLLHRGERFAERLVGILREDGSARLAHVATDGESYGHHHRHGDMALAFALRAIEARNWARLTNYGEFLEQAPPAYEVQIFENTSWSCAHGVERWRSDCGCRTGGQPEWNQAWRAPLRDALDWLRERIRPPCERKMQAIFAEPRSAILDYIELVLDRRRESADRFFQKHCREAPGEAQRVTALSLLEMQRQLQLMYTSCGWFFNDVAGIETVQVLQYAARAVQLAEDLFDEPVERGFLERVARARSNRPEMGTGRDIYERRVKPTKTTWEMLGAHYGISSLFESYPRKTTFYCYEVERDDYQSHRSGRTMLAVGKIQVTSQITQASSVLSFAVLHFGDHGVTAGVRRHRGEESYRTLAAELVEPFRKADTTAVLRLIDQHFQNQTFDLKSLFGDEQRRVVDSLLESSLAEAEAALRHLYEHHGATMRFLADLGVPAPRALSVAAEVVLNAYLRRALADEAPDEHRVGALLREAVDEGVALDDVSLAFTARQSVEEVATHCFEALDDLERLKRLHERVRLIRSLPFEVDLWKVQNSYFQCMKRILPQRDEAPRAGEWRDVFLALGDELSIRLPEHR